MDRPAAREDALLDGAVSDLFRDGSDFHPELAHHTIVLGERYKELLEDIFQKKILANDFSLYLHAPTRTDPSLAPPGCECFYVLSPVPHLGGDVDWNAVKEAYADRRSGLAGEVIVPTCGNTLSAR